MIRLGPRTSGSPPAEESATDGQHLAESESRRGFDYERFETRLESLWFQRKAFLADGADDKAAEQGRLIEAFCREEGIRSLETVAGALLAETEAHLDAGRYNRALAALELAQSLDPGRAQIHFARAVVYWNAAGRNGQALLETLRGVAATATASLRDLSLFRRIALTFVVALAGTVFLFSLVMLLRYQLPFRHEIEEWTLRYSDPRLARPAGWAVLLAPILVWTFAGWCALYWIAVTFRFMRRAERAAAVTLLLGCVAALPIYRSAVAVYSLTADPVVRTTLASADGEYDPDRIVRLRKLVDAHPENASYRFLLAGLYKNGRFFEEAFEAYKQALSLEPGLHQAHINIGNIFALTGQYGEAIAHQQKALESAPRSVLALFNMHLAQTEAFRFREAEDTLRRAREIDPQRVAELMNSRTGDRTTLIDAQLRIESIWSAALGGHEGGGPSLGGIVAGVANPVGIGSLGALLVGLGLWIATRGGEAARRCIRCGNAFCDACKHGSEGREYCTQCLHLYVLGDGLAPETKTKKLFEVARHERRDRRLHRLLSLLLPGTAQLARGRALTGTVLLLCWVGAWVGALPEGVALLDRIAGVRLRLDALDIGPVPAAWSLSTLGLVCAAMGLVVWLAGNGLRGSRREA